MERNVPKLRFKGFNDEWKKEVISSICKLSSGSTPSKARKEYFNGTHLWVTSGELKNKYIYNTIDKITDKAIKNTNLKEYEIGSFIIAIYGLEAQGTRGSSAILGRKATISQACMAIEPVKDIYSEFLYYWYAKYGDMIGIRYAQGTKQQNLSTDLVGNLKIIFPSLKEQERITNFLTKVDKIIEKQDEKVKNLENYKKGMMQKIFSQEIRFKDENGEEYPEWEEARLNNVLSIPEKIKTEIIEKDKLLTVKLHMQGIKVNKNVDTLNIGATVYYKRKAGQFIYGKQNFFNGAFGIVPEELDGYLSSGDIPALNINRDRIIPEYLINYIGRTEFYKKTENLSSGTGSKRIHEKTLLEIVINIPCVAEQERIANFLSNIDLVIDKENKKLEELKRWKKGLLQQMFV
ncbi:restriction endonuclease subunit S [Clostridium sp.]|uniref:restriction endonuclease subunit S n=1 Tax=Clostridium sp. TaxID=1506 RepID=UPI0035207C80